MEKKTEEAKQWNVGPDPGRETETKSRDEGEPGARPGYRAGLTVLPLLFQTSEVCFQWQKQPWGYL